MLKPKEPETLPKTLITTIGVAGQHPWQSQNALIRPIFIQIQILTIFLHHSILIHYDGAGYVMSHQNIPILFHKMVFQWFWLTLSVADTSRSEVILGISNGRAQFPKGTLKINL